MGYRLNFLDVDGKALWTHELEARSDSQAILLAYALAEACSDECRNFELWSGMRRIRAMDAEALHRIAVSVNGLAQASALRHECLIRDSQTRIAQSQRLLARISDLERRLVAEQHLRV